MRSTLIVVLAIAVLGCAAEATQQSPAAEAADPNRLTGTVLETMDVSNYTYLHLETPAGEAWAAVPKADLEVGAPVVVVNPQTMVDFESKTLGRKFETIYFGTLEGQGASSSTAQAGADSHGAMHGGAARTGDPGDATQAPIEVAKAEGATGRTVAELYAEKDQLAGKTVSLRGKVVKYNSGIMGRNWFHLQDGTGDASSGNHDITVTSVGATAVGETVLVRGTLAVDKDFGAGYRYAVIVEEASVE
jgi:hypothetical protein